jgi:hypothetical protein
MTTIEGVDIDQALLDECRRIGNRLDTVLPQLRELLAVAAAALVKVEVGLMKHPPELGDDGYERFIQASGVGRVYKIMLELHQACDFDTVILADGAYVAATHNPE